MNFKGLLALSFIPVILTGCSSGMTPSFSGTDQNVSVSPSGSSDSVEVSEQSEKGHEKKKGEGEGTESSKSTEEAVNSKESSKDDKTSKSDNGTYKLSEHDKKIGMKLDENGNPYFAGKNPEDGIISTEPDIPADENTKNTSIYDPTSSDLDQAIAMGNKYIKNVKAKKWKQACADVYEVDGRNCASYLEFVYKDGNTFKEYEKGNVNGVVISKKSLRISISDKDYESNQRMTFIKEDGDWKIFIK